MATGRRKASGALAGLAMAFLAGCAGGSSGGSGSAAADDPGGPPPTTGDAPNPYANEGDTSPTRLGRLTVFGDSYSVNNPTLRPNVRVWSGRLSADATSIYARGTATAGDQSANGAANDFRTQVDRWLAEGTQQRGNDLTVAYLGYNDIQFTDFDIDASLGSYRREVDRLLANRAGDGDRKLFVTLVHDWSQVPKELDEVAAGGSSKRDRVDAFNRGLVQLANDRDDVVAVDLRTVFDRIAADPGRYGLENLRTADPAAADGTALYTDPIHFGNRGQDLIAQVFRHYLTRGWSWANGLAAGAEATSRLQADIDRGLVVSLAEPGGAPVAGFSSFAVGDGQASTAALVEARAADPSRAHFMSTRLGQEDSGLGLNYAVDRDTMLGVVISDYRDDEATRLPLATSEAEVEATGASVYLRHQLAGFRLATTATVSDDRHAKRDRDALIDSATRAEYGGRTTALAANLSRPVRAGRGWMQPWLSLTQMTQETEGFEQSDPYVSDLRFSGARVADTLLAVGLGGSLDPLQLGGTGSLALSGGLSYTHGLAQDDYKVRVEETATGFAHEQEVEREPTRLLGLRLGAELDVGQRFTLDTAYGLARQLGGAAAQEVTAELRYAF